MNLCMKLRLESSGPNINVLKAGEKGEKFYVIVRGRVGIWIVLEGDEGYELKELK